MVELFFVLSNIEIKYSQNEILAMYSYCRLEHAKRPSNCGFLSLTKNFDDLTVEEYYLLEMDRLRTFLVRACV